MTIELAPHQVEALNRALAMLDSRGGVLLADEVGLGKSFVAAAVAKRLAGEWRSEFIVPASLVAQWESTLASFAVEAHVTTHDRIVSQPFVPLPNTSRLVVVDEAHVFRNPQTQRFDALARRSIGARVLLITATPVCNSVDDLYTLVSLIAADDALRAAGIPSIEYAFRARDPAQIAVIRDALVIRRGRDAVDERLRFGSLQREIIRHEIPDTAIDDLRFPLVSGHHSLLRNFLWRRLESSEAALLESLARQSRFYDRALDCLASGKTLTKRDYRRMFGDDEGDAFQEVLFWEVFASEGSRASAEGIREEVARLDAIRRNIEGHPRQKILQLTSLLCDTNEAALVFTSAVATANDIFTTLRGRRRAGIVTSRHAEPLDAIDAFRRGAIDLLVCTDLAAEGLNLQRAGVVVHYDVPWNPVRLDQRNGRAFRIGQQRSVVRAVYFLPRGRRTRVVETVASKNRARRSALETPAAASNAHAGAVASRLALPHHLVRASPPVVLFRELRRRRIDVPDAVLRRHRAGLERLFCEMAREFLDRRRVADLTALVERERIIAAGAAIGPSDR